MGCSSRTAIAMCSTMLEDSLTGKPPTIHWKGRACDQSERIGGQPCLSPDEDDPGPAAGARLSPAFWWADDLHHWRHVLCRSPALADALYRKESAGAGHRVDRLRNPSRRHAPGGRLAQ